MDKQINEPKNVEKTRFNISLSVSLLVVGIMWFVKIIETALNVSFSDYGVFPHSLIGLRGIFFAPFLHGSFKHLLSNTIPMIALVTSFLYFFPKFAFKLLPVIFVVPEILLWLIGRESYHIGASTQIYALVSFIFFNGVFSRKRDYIALSLIVVFLYGGIIWGMFPGGDPQVSWEGHLSGFIVGVVLALFLSEKPQKSNIKTEQNVCFEYNYEQIFTNSTCKSKIIYNFETNKPKQKLFYEKNFNVTVTDFTAVWYESTTTIF